LTNRNYQKWIVPPEDDSIQKFDPVFFVQGSNTVYALSSEKGESNASALVTAICNDLVEVAENYAKTSPGSHLPYPMLVALDEAANICRWEKLPDLYSYYRAYGITLLTVLQSYSQGTEVWQENGMKKIWSAANIILFLGGISEPDFLQNISNLCGQYEYTSTSVSYDSLSSIVKGSQASDQRTNVLEVSDLQVWPQGKNFIKLWRNKIFNSSKGGKVYQPRRTLLLSADAILILETKPYFESFTPQLLEIIAKGSKAYEERRANVR
jgi:hypothetical protein